MFVFGKVLGWNGGKVPVLVKGWVTVGWKGRGANGLVIVVEGCTIVKGLPPIMMTLGCPVPGNPGFG